MSNFLRLVGENVRLLRKKKGLTQEELAERVNLQSSYIGGVERGERNISLLTLEKISEGLDVLPEDLFDFSKIRLNDLTGNQLLSICNSLLRSRNIKELQFIINFLHNFSEFRDDDKYK